MVSKSHNRFHDPKGQENKIYTLLKGREMFYCNHTVPFTSCSDVKYVLKMAIIWKLIIHQRTERVECASKLSGPDYLVSASKASSVTPLLDSRYNTKIRDCKG